jgi:hypothetical protein
LKEEGQTDWEREAAGQSRPRIVGATITYTSGGLPLSSMGFASASHYKAYGHTFFLGTMLTEGKVNLR